MKRKMYQRKKKMSKFKHKNRITHKYLKKIKFINLSR